MQDGFGAYLPKFLDSRGLLTPAAALPYGVGGEPGGIVAARRSFGYTILKKAGKERIELLLRVLDYLARELEFMQLMRKEGARLVVLVGGVVEDDAYRGRVAHYAQALDDAGARLVLCGRPAPDPGIPALVVEFDNEAGARAVTGHLLSVGHRRIVFPGGLGNTALDARVAGYRAALAEHGLPAEAAHVVDCGLGRAAGHRGMTELLTSTREFTAVFAGDDMVAAGALRAIADAGLRVPHDISVVGYNDIPLAEDSNPPLTTVRTPAEELGRAAVRIALRDPDHTAGTHHLLGTHIVVRDSVQPPPS